MGASDKEPSEKTLLLGSSYENNRNDDVTSRSPSRSRSRTRSGSYPQALTGALARSTSISRINVSHFFILFQPSFRYKRSSDSIHLLHFILMYSDNNIICNIMTNMNMIITIMSVCIYNSPKSREVATTEMLRDFVQVTSELPGVLNWLLFWSSVCSLMKYLSQGHFHEHNKTLTLVSHPFTI